MKKHYLIAFALTVFLAAGCSTATQRAPVPPTVDIKASAKPVDVAPAPVKPVPVVPPSGAAPKSTIVIQTQSSLSGIVGQEFVAIFTANGGVEPYAWRIAKGTLPPGLSLEPILVIPDCAPPAPPEKPNCRAPYNDPQSIKITGTPTNVGSFPVTLSATDSSGMVGVLVTTFVIQ